MHHFYIAFALYPLYCDIYKHHHTTANHNLTTAKMSTLTAADFEAYLKAMMELGFFV
jgi:hypothetical protein